MKRILSALAATLFLASAAHSTPAIPPPVPTPQPLDIPFAKFDPAVYLPHSIAAGANAKYCIVGDSTSTTAFANTVTLPPTTSSSATGTSSVDLLWDQLRTRIVEDAAAQGVTLSLTGNFFNYAIGGTTLIEVEDGSTGSANPIGVSYPSWWTNTSSGKWLSYGVANGCTAWFINMGVNDPGNETGQIWVAVLTQLATSTYHPDIVIITNKVGNIAAGTPYSEYTYQAGYIANQLLQRSISLAPDNMGLTYLPKIGLLDIGRAFDMTVLGFDPVKQTLQYVINPSSPLTVGTGWEYQYVLPGATSDGPTSATTGTSYATGTQTVTFSGSTVYPVGSLVKITGMTPLAYNNDWIVSASSAGSVSFLNASDFGAQTVAGTIQSTTPSNPGGDFFLDFSVTNVPSNAPITVWLGDPSGGSGSKGGATSNEIQISTNNGVSCYMNWYNAANVSVNSGVNTWVSSGTNRFVIIAKGSRVQMYCNGSLAQEGERVRYDNPWSPVIRYAQSGSNSESLTINAYAVGIPQVTTPVLAAPLCYGVSGGGGPNSGNGSVHDASNCLNQVDKLVLDATKFAAPDGLRGVYNQLPVVSSGFSSGTLATTAASGTGTVATITFSGSTVYPVGYPVTVAGVTPSGYNGTYTVTASSAGSVSYANATTGSQSVAGTVAFTPTAIGSGGTYSFTADIGVTPGATGVWTMPSSRTGWNCTAQDRTTTSATVLETGSTPTSVTFALASTVAGDVVQFNCTAN